VPVEDGLGFLGRVTFATLGLGEALVERGVDGVAVAEEPVVHGLVGRGIVAALGFEEIEEVVEEGVGLAEVSGLELALEALFGGGSECDAHV